MDSGYPREFLVVLYHLNINRKKLLSYTELRERKGLFRVVTIINLFDQTSFLTSLNIYDYLIGGSNVIFYFGLDFISLHVLNPNSIP